MSDHQPNAAYRRVAEKVSEAIDDVLPDDWACVVVLLTPSQHIAVSGVHVSPEAGTRMLEEAIKLNEGRDNEH